MAARLMQALLLPAVLGLLSMTAPMQLLALPVRSPDTGRVLLSMPLGAQARPSWRSRPGRTACTRS
jgi:hypothetical protein